MITRVVIKGDTRSLDYSSCSVSQNGHTPLDSTAKEITCIARVL